MQIVINIPDEKYERLVYLSDVDLKKYIKKGTKLPKGHGRLGDLDALEEEMIGGINAGLMIDGYEDYSHINDTEDCLECVKYADTIIEADKKRSRG